LTCGYENTREPNCEGINDGKALRGIRTGLVAVFGPTMADSANLKSLLSPKAMAGGFAATGTDSAPFSIRPVSLKTSSSSKTPSPYLHA
jgi:hypothetical protein